jgi:hypothetical protein
MNPKPTNSWKVFVGKRGLFALIAKILAQSLLNQKNVIYEQWVYSVDRYIYLENGIVVSIQE